jgi:hypothetical protein
MKVVILVGGSGRDIGAIVEERVVGRGWYDSGGAGTQYARGC